jgi:hypothetical protein
MLSQKPYIHSKEEEEAVEVAEDGGVTIAEAEEATTSAPRCGAAGVARTPTTSKIAGRRTVTTVNGHALVAIRKADSGVTDAVKWDISGNTVQSAGMEVEMEMEMEMMEAEVVSTVKAMEDKDPVVPEAGAEVVSTTKAMEDKDPVPEVEVEVASMVKALEDKDPVAPEVEAEVVSTTKATEDKDLVKAVDKAEVVTTARSCLEMVPTIRNDSWGRPPSILR